VIVGYCTTRVVAFSRPTGTGQYAAVVEIRDAETERFVSLSPIDYQFPDITDDQWDSHWLMIRGTARTPDEDSHVWPGATQNLEPNIGLGLVQSTEGSATLRVFLRAESGPPSVQRDDQLSDMQFFFDLTTLRAALGRAAAEWDAELRKFPERGEPSR